MKYRIRVGLLWHIMDELGLQVGTVEGLWCHIRESTTGRLVDIFIRRRGWGIGRWVVILVIITCWGGCLRRGRKMRKREGNVESSGLTFVFLCFCGALFLTVPPSTAVLLRLLD